MKFLYSSVILLTIALNISHCNTTRCSFKADVNIDNGENKYSGEAYWDDSQPNPDYFDYSKDVAAAYYQEHIANRIETDDPTEIDLFEDIGFDFADEAQQAYLLYLLYGYDYAVDLDDNDLISENGKNGLRVYLYDMKHFENGGDIKIMDLTQLQDNREQDTDTVLAELASHADDKKPNGFVGFSGQNTPNLTFEIVDRLRYSERGKIKITQETESPLFGDDRTLTEFEFRGGRSDRSWTIDAFNLCIDPDFKKL